MSAAADLIGETQFTEMYAMDFARDAFLMSHMGEGNWALARDDGPVRLIKRTLGIGGLDDPPTFLFHYGPGPATLATLVALGDERFRLVVSEGEILDTDELPALEMPYGFFRPDAASRVRRRLASIRRAASSGLEPGSHRGGLAAFLRGGGDRNGARRGGSPPTGGRPRAASMTSPGARAPGSTSWETTRTTRAASSFRSRSTAT